MDTTPIIEAQADEPDLSKIVGRAVKRQRHIADITVRNLAKLSGVSPAMISRIENGQVSPSLSTLEALAEALSLSVVAFFADSVQTSDVLFVKSGQGLQATRTFSNHHHFYRVLGRHRDDQLSFEAASVTIDQDPTREHPKYINRGYVFITVTSGECVYGCGDQEFQMSPGDSISFDAELVHGVKAVLSPTVTYTSVSARIH